MYQFPDEFRKAYESMTVPLVVFQFENEKVIPLLVSDGFCQLTGLNREKALEMMGASQYNRVHPDDAGKVAKVSDDFAHHRSEYNQLVRCRHEDGYHLLHVIGYWQTMPGGTELAFLTYTDVSASQKAIEDSALKYLLFQQDQFTHRQPHLRSDSRDFKVDLKVQSVQDVEGFVPYDDDGRFHSSEFFTGQP